jgi:hypothetical protein
VSLAHLFITLKKVIAHAKYNINILAYKITSDLSNSETAKNRQIIKKNSQLILTKDKKLLQIMSFCSISQRARGSLFSLPG